MLEFTSYDVEQTERVGRSLGALLAAGDVIALSGDLGAGKTAFTRGIGAGWGAREAVTSPTFTLMHEHHRPPDDQVLYHVDCYRLTSLDDAWGIGLDDLLYGQHPVVLEWAENIEDLLPPERLWIQIAILDGTRRQVSITARGARYNALLDALRSQIPG